VQLRSIYQSNHTTNTTTKYTNLVPFRANSLSLSLTLTHSHSLTVSAWVGIIRSSSQPLTYLNTKKKKISAAKITTRAQARMRWMVAKEKPNKRIRGYATSKYCAPLCSLAKGNGKLVSECLSAMWFIIYKHQRRCSVATLACTYRLWKHAIYSGDLEVKCYSVASTWC
jgi:hypothetical protein